MGQKQLLIIVLGIIIVAIAVVFVLTVLSSRAADVEASALSQDVHYIASAASAYWSRPGVADGKARTFIGTKNVTAFGADTSNANGNFVMTSITVTQFTLTATGVNEGVVIRATITQNGLSGVYTIHMPPFF